MPRTRTLTTALLAAACTVALGTGCTRLPAAGTIGGAPGGTASPQWQAHYLTVDHGDLYSVVDPGDGSVAVLGGTLDQGSNTRVLAVDAAQAPAGDQQICTTVDGPAVPTQPGLAVRVTDDGTAVRAVTLTRNVWGYADTFYNLMVWDSSRTEPVPADLVAQHDHPELTGYRGPLDMCLRAVGDTVSFKVWAHGSAAPAWSAPVALPPGYASGASGVYAGHLTTASQFTYTSVVAGPPTA